MVILCRKGNIICSRWKYLHQTSRERKKEMFMRKVFFRTVFFERFFFERFFFERFFFERFFFERFFGFYLLAFLLFPRTGIQEYQNCLPVYDRSIQSVNNINTILEERASRTQVFFFFLIKKGPIKKNLASAYNTRPMVRTEPVNKPPPG